MFGKNQPDPLSDYVSPSAYKKACYTCYILLVVTILTFVFASTTYFLISLLLLIVQYVRILRMLKTRMKPKNRYLFQKYSDNRAWSNY